MNSVFFSPGSKSFYLQELFPEYEDAGTLPDDVIEITRETYEQFLGLHPEGKEIGADGNDSNLLIVFYVQIMPDDFVMQLHRF